uniref:Translation initiation factor beta propellor-like domain-containing protein n=1 Tax=Parascaris equorum TaxID=6256 RepID=A0A914RKE5_PAREQ
VVFTVIVSSVVFDRRGLIEVPNTTLLEWAPDGQHLLTATTTPRLRIDNGYRIWHYSGRLIHENLYEYPSELWQVQWRPIADGVYNRFHVSTLTAEDKTKTGLIIRLKNAPEHPANNLPAGAITKGGAYNVSRKIKCVAGWM